MSFHFFQEDEIAVLFRQPRQQFQHEIALRQRVVHGVRTGLNSLSGALHLVSILFREVALVYQLTNSLLSQVVVALVHRDLVDPGQQRTAEVEVLDGEIDFENTCCAISSASLWLRRIP
jgi:hypothetical protein